MGGFEDLLGFHDILGRRPCAVPLHYPALSKIFGPLSAFGLMPINGGVPDGMIAGTLTNDGKDSASEVKQSDVLEMKFYRI